MEKNSSLFSWSLYALNGLLMAAGLAAAATFAVLTGGIGVGLLVALPFVTGSLNFLVAGNADRNASHFFENQLAQLQQQIDNEELGHDDSVLNRGFIK